MERWRKDPAVSGGIREPGVKVPVMLLVWALTLHPILDCVESHAEETIHLRPGFQKILDRPGITRLSIGNPEIIEAQPLSRGDGVLVVGKKEGETDLVLWEKEVRTEWRVEVRSVKASLVEGARSFAGTFPGLTVKEAGGDVIVSGAVETARDRAVIEEYARAHPGVRLRLSNPEEKRTLLQYDLNIVEISRGETKQLGIRWPDAIPVKGTITSRTDSGRTVTLGTDFETRLGLLLADGKARILSNPRLACESGEDALFLAGGEIPIVIITPETRTVEWKTYGIILRIHPTMTLGGKIRTQVTAEVSTVDHGSGSADVPGFLTRRVSTHFTTAPGETVMLSGLVKSEMARDIAKVPLLGQIPVIGELFKSRSFRENQTELAIFITPNEVGGDATREAAEWSRKAAREKETMRFRLLD
jgi:pilus assembly protein CpaC